VAVEFITIVWRSSPYRAEKLLVQLALADWSNLDGEFHPTYKQIAEKARITRPGAIGIIQAMIEDGEIVMVEHSAGGGRGKRNHFRFAEKYCAAVRELSRRWSSKRAERVKQDDSFKGAERVNEDDSFKPKRVKGDDSFRAKKGKRETAHIRNKPSCLPANPLLQQQAADPPEQLPAAAYNDAHSSRFPFPDVEAFVEATKPHIKNPGGLARIIWRSGEEDERIERWTKRQQKRQEIEERQPSPEIAADFSMDDWIDDLIANNWIAQLENEREQIEAKGGPKLDYERKIIAYFNNRAASEAAQQGGNQWRKS